MEPVAILPASELIQVVEKLNGAVEALCSKTKRSEKEFVGNEEFMQIMGISKRTAQSWRDDGVIAFSQVGSKIYYSMTDIAKLMQSHRCEQYSEANKRKGGTPCS